MNRNVFVFTPPQHHPQVGEVDLGLTAGLVGLRHETLLHAPAGLGGDLGSPPGQIVPHRGIRNTHRCLLIDQPGQHPAGGMPLFAGCVQIVFEPAVDDRFVFLQPAGHPHRGFPRRRQRRRQRLPHRPAVHTMSIRQLPDRQLLHPRITADRSEQLHLDSIPSPFDECNTDIGRVHRQMGPHQTVTRCPACRDGAESNRHNRPIGSAQVEPLQTVTPGPNQTVRARVDSKTQTEELGTRVAVYPALVMEQTPRHVDPAKDWAGVPGIYVLTGTDVQQSSTRTGNERTLTTTLIVRPWAYVGLSEDFHGRIGSHRQSKPEWRRALLVRSGAQPFTSDDIRYLEQKVHAVLDATGEVLLSQTTPRGNLSAHPRSPPCSTPAPTLWWRSCA